MRNYFSPLVYINYTIYHHNLLAEELDQVRYLDAQKTNS